MDDYDGGTEEFGGIGALTAGVHVYPFRRRRAPLWLKVGAGVALLGSSSRRASFGDGTVPPSGGTADGYRTNIGGALLAALGVDLIHHPRHAVWLAAQLEPLFMYVAERQYQNRYRYVLPLSVDLGVRWY
jgi:hypothetical protein